MAHLVLLLRVARPHSYAWADDATITTPDRNNLMAGSYTVTVTDAFGCQVVATYT